MPSTKPRGFAACSYTATAAWPANVRMNQVPVAGLRLDRLAVACSIHSSVATAAYRLAAART